jgi:DNA polymerase-3 subunit alpha
MILIFDTETTGLPRRGESVTSPNYPRLVEIAGILIEESDSREIASFALLIRPDGYEIPDGMVHGITQAQALAAGVPVRVALAVYSNLRRVSSAVAGHNVEFDNGIIASEFYKAGVHIPADIVDRETLCTAELGRPICALPPTERMTAAGYGGQFKMPNLTELHTHLFGEPFDGAHGALADVRAAARCLLELRRQS